MKVTKYNNYTEIEKALVQQKSKPGKCNDCRRVFVLDAGQGKLAVASLNCFQRMALWILKIFKVNYFQNVFGTKNIKIVSPRMLEKRINDEKILKSTEKTTQQAKPILPSPQKTPKHRLRKAVTIIAFILLQKLNPLPNRPKNLRVNLR